MYEKRSLAKRLLLRFGHRVIAPYLDQTRMAHAILPRRHFFWQAFKALAMNRISGAYAEFGVLGAGSFSTAYAMSRRSGFERRFWGFDSFQGLPASTSEKDKHPQWKEGRFKKSIEEFHRACEEKGLPRADYEVVPGFFADTLANMAPDDEPADVAFAFVDCDMYSSTLAVLEFLGPRLKHGMLLAFDDYNLWSADQLSGERRAFLELYSSHPRWHFEPFQPVSWHGTSFLVEDRALHPKPLSH